MVAVEGASTPALAYDDMPAAFRVSDHLSLQSQRKTTRWTGWQLTMLVVAAAVAFIPWEIDDSLHVGGLLSFFVFAIAFGLALRLATERPMDNWYEGRAGAESVKTLAWRYAVGGDPFPIGLPGTQVDELFEARLREVMSQLSDLRWSGGGVGDQITPRMREMRSWDLATRKAAYADARIHEQQQWYDSKAETNHRRAQRWGLLGLLASMAGLVAALLRATLVFDPEIDPLSVFATLATAVTAWIQARQFQTLATSYGIAGQELGTIAIRLAHVATEPAWAAFVRDAEAAISREHTLWLTRRAEVAV